MKTFSNNHHLHPILFGFIILLAAFFRLYGQNWDSGFHLHPDERMLVMVTERLHLPKSFPEFLSPESSLNPKFFPYGSFPIYLLKIISNLAANVFRNPSLSSYSLNNLVGRLISALFDLGTLLIVFNLGKKIFSTSVGLLAAAFYGFCAFPIQLSHFFAVDTILTFFVTLTLYRLIIFYEKRSLKNALLSGVFFGFALATKISATVLVASIGTAIIMEFVLIVGRRLRLSFKHQKIFFSTEKRLVIFKNKLIALAKFIFTNTKFIVIIIFIACITFVILEPYSLIDFPTFWRQTKEQQAMTKNAYVFPYTLQYIGTAFYLYHLKNFVLWGAGIPLGLVCVASIFYLVFYLAREFPRPGNEKQEAEMLILLSFFFAYFFIVGRFAVKFMRYFLPLYPLFFIFAAWFLLVVLKRHTLLKNFLVIFTLFFSLFWSISFLNIYSRPNTRVAASYWINNHIPAGSLLAIEHWDDRLPLFGSEKYQFLEMPMYENDSSLLKWNKINNNLQKADYLILASNRLYVPLQKLKDCKKYKICYPKTAQYYQDLFSGKLGFKKIVEFTSYPKFSIFNFQFSIPDNAADESFTVYDHPKVIIFKKQ